MSTVRETVQQNITALVDYEGSPSAFAERIGVSRQSVNNWINGKNAPDIEMINQIAREYHVLLSVILEGDISKQGIKRPATPTTSELDALTSDEKNLLSLYRQMDADDKKTFMRNAQLFAFAGEAKKRDDLRIAKGARKTVKQ